MISPEVILQVSATMIVGSLFLITIAKMWKDLEATVLLVFYTATTIPFSVSAILVLLGPIEYAKGFCIVGFVFVILLISIFIFLKSKEELQKLKEQKI